MRRVVAGLCLMAGALAGIGRAEVKLPAIISDHAVLQRDRAVPIWGWADQGEQVTVSLADRSATVTPDAQGRWEARLSKDLPVGGPYELVVQGKNKVVVKDVLVGEVWLGSGQSNMAWTVDKSRDFPAEREKARFPMIRMFKETSGPAGEPKLEGKGQWVVCSPETVGGFSATGYFFGREIHQALGVPVGVINSSVGGTPVEAWTRWEAQKDLPELKPLFESWEKRIAAWDPAKAAEQHKLAREKHKVAVEKAKAEGKTPPAAPRAPVDPKNDTHRPAVLFNAKINPLIPYGVRGAIWYQGENNAGGPNAKNYGLQLRTMIADWRKLWIATPEDFAFAWVQLPNFRKAQEKPVEESGWVVVREQMTDCLAVPGTGMAITLELGEANDIHPKDKQNVGKRLAQWALHSVYGKKEIAPSGPLYEGHAVKGSEVLVRFKHAHQGLKLNPAARSGFAIRGSDGEWKWGNARVDGETVVVSHPEIQQPVAVRYAWADNPVATLFNGAGLPAAPFRTDRGK